MNQKKSLLILCGVLVVMVGAYFGVTTYNENKALEAAAEEAILEQLNTVYITQLTEDDIVGVSWSCYSDVAFTLEDEAWSYTEDSSLTLDAYYIEAVISTYSNLVAERELIDGDELASYGLEEPLYYVVLTDNTGAETTYYIGNEVEESYYLTIDDKTDIYTVSSTVVEALYYGITDIVEADTFSSPSSDELQEVSITYVTDTSEEATEDEATEETTEVVYTVDDTDAMEMIADGLSILTLSDCVDVNASSNLDWYGLEEECRTTWTMVYYITTEIETTEEETEEVTEETSEEASEEETEVEVVVEEFEETLYIGYYEETYDMYYVQVEDSDMVYMVAADTVDYLLNQSVASDEESTEISYDFSDYFY